MALLSRENRFFFQCVFALTIVGLWWMFTPNQKRYEVELPESLASIQCPASANSENNSALVFFNEDKIYHPCVPDNLVQLKQYLGCEPLLDSFDCGETANFYLSFSHRKSDDAIYAGYYPESYLNHKEKVALATNQDKEKFKSERSSYVLFGFSKSPPKDWKSGLETMDVSVKDVPERFSYLREFTCNPESTALDAGMCNAVLKTGNTTIHMNVEVPKEEYKPIKKSVYRGEIKRWLLLLDELVLSVGGSS